LADLSSTIANLRIGSTGYATLLDDRGRLVASGNEALTAELQDWSDHPALATTGSQEPMSYVDKEGREIVGYSVESDYGWKLIVQQDHEEAFEVATRTQQHALILIGITLIVVLLIATLLAAGLSRPIRNLTAIADNISRGELGTKIVETSRRDEIGALARAIERMGVSLEMAFQRLRKK
jgi:methyl-accepting chemotaxis protein